MEKLLLFALKWGKIKRGGRGGKERNVFLDKADLPKRGAAKV